MENYIKKIAIYGTGSSAVSLQKELGDEVLIDCFYETSPQNPSFDGKPVYGLENLKADIDELYVASMYYPEIMERLIQKSFPIEKVTVAVAHRDDPRFGTIRLSGESLLPKIPEYKAFQAIINDIESKVAKGTTLTFFNRLDHLVFALSHAPKNGHVMEFGVYRGESLLHLAAVSERPVWGFDSFCGFSEGSIYEEVKSEVLRKKIEIPAKLTAYEHLVPGYFEDTIERWLDEAKSKEIAFVHYDAGHYEATRFVLSRISDFLVPGTIIVFDELIPCQTELKANEYDALVDILTDRHEFLSRCGQSVAIQIV